MSAFINKVIKTLMFGDLFLNLGWGLLSPVFAIFILERISNVGPLHAAEIAGLAALFYWIPKSLFEIPVGIYLDRVHGEKDDFWAMLLGQLLVAFVPIGYFFSSLPWHIYILQVIYALGMAIALPSWMAIFTRHIDKGKEAFEWGMLSSSIGMGAGIAGGLSGIVVSFLGFQTLLFVVSGFTMLATILLLSLRKHVFTRDGHLIYYSGGRPVIEP